MDEKVAYIMSQVACALIDMEAMKAENQNRRNRGESIAYPSEAFFEIQDKYCIGHNAVLSHLNG